MTSWASSSATSTAGGQGGLHRAAWQRRRRACSGAPRVDVRLRYRPAVEDPGSRIRICNSTRTSRYLPRSKKRSWPGSAANNQHERSGNSRVKESVSHGQGEIPAATKPHVNVGTMANIDTQDTLTAAITKVMAEQDPANNSFWAFDDIDKARRRRPGASPSSFAHVEYSTPTATTPTWTCPATRLHQEHDHRRAQVDGAILVVSGPTGPMPRPVPCFWPPGGGALHRGGAEQGRRGRRRGAVGPRRARGRELLSEYDFPGEETPVIRVSALKASRRPGLDPKISELMEAVDSWVPEPDATSTALPDVDTRTCSPSPVGARWSPAHRAGHSSRGRRRGDRGPARYPEDGLHGVEMFRKLLDEGKAGDNAGILLRGPRRRTWSGARCCASPARSPRTPTSRPSLHLEEGGGRAPQAVLQQLPPQSTSHHRCDRLHHPARGQPRWSCPGQHHHDRGAGQAHRHGRGLNLRPSARAAAPWASGASSRSSSSESSRDRNHMAVQRSA